jgi:tRNA dimethylallyltransferase
VPPRRTILVLVGPTASGKTSVALALGSVLNVEIVSADSRQVYRDLDIGTAKPSPDERKRIPHHFVDMLSPDQDFSAGEFGLRARLVCSEILGRNRLPLIVGGSGLYVQALVDGFSATPGADPEYRAWLESRVVKEGIPVLLADLERVDPETARTIDRTKPRRIIRALEIHHLTGTAMSAIHRDTRTESPFVPAMFGLDWPRPTLYQRINSRCEEMLRQGLLREVDELKQRGFDDSLNALNTVGYKEAFRYSRGEIEYGELVRLLKQNSRRYAKRQLTWFRRDNRIRWIPMSAERTPESVAAEIAELFKGRPGDR